MKCPLSNTIDKLNLIAIFVDLIVELEAVYLVIYGIKTFISPIPARLTYKALIQ